MLFGSGLGGASEKKNTVTTESKNMATPATTDPFQHRSLILLVVTGNSAFKPVISLAERICFPTTP
jgi:hypothetical protein